MGYTLRAFIGRIIDLQVIVGTYNSAKIVNTGQDISIIPMTEELFDEINNFKSSKDINSFMFLTDNIEREIFKIIGTNCIGYVEADYFGGQGEQVGILWKGNQRHKVFNKTQSAINCILRHFGVISAIGKDEFDTINLGRHRETNDWLES